MRNYMVIFAVLFAAGSAAYGQHCDCAAEFSYIKAFVEKNYAGFPDKLKLMGAKKYSGIVDSYQKLAKQPNSAEKCLLIISGYLDRFNDDHIQVSPAFDATKTDSVYASRRSIVQVQDSKIEKLKKSTTAEGVYLSTFDSAYRIAVYKEKNSLYDYAGVIINSKLPSWKKGMAKFYGRQINDSLLKGVLYMRNHMPKVEWFYVGRNMIGGDWLREGSVKEKFTYNYVPVASKKLSGKTFYIKISNFGPSSAKRIDSVFKANEDILKNTPYLVLDLRGNGGGSDFAFSPILPYLYTNPVKNIGVDVLSTEPNIAGWKKLLEDEDIPVDTKRSIEKMIEKMENEKGKLVNIVADETDSSFTVAANPKKVVILIDRGCASTTEQLLLFAMQSSKVILMGENTQGTLDYSNMREAPFSCMPYTLRYATTRSRRLDVGQGIDEAGIKPRHYLKQGEDWIQAAVGLLEK